MLADCARVAGLNDQRAFAPSCSAWAAECPTFDEWQVAVIADDRDHVTSMMHVTPAAPFMSLTCSS
ncbi:MAG TPA: hypothetical protein VI365_20055 [Trebonia sp.]